MTLCSRSDVRRRGCGRSLQGAQSEGSRSHHIAGRGGCTSGRWGLRAAQCKCTEVFSPPPAQPGQTWRLVVPRPLQCWRTAGRSALHFQSPPLSTTTSIRPLRNASAITGLPRQAARDPRVAGWQGEGGNGAARAGGPCPRVAARCAP